MPSVTPGISQGGLEIVTIPCLSDNYAYLVKGPRRGLPDRRARGRAHHRRPGGARLDAGDDPDHPSPPRPRRRRGGLRRRYGCEVMGPEAERDKLPPIDMGLKDGDAGGEGPARTVAIAVSRPHAGTSGLPLPRGGPSSPPTASWRWAAGGCSRARPDDVGEPVETRCPAARDAGLSGHEYTQSNARFALTIEPGNAALVARAKEVDAARAAGRPTVPSTLAEELATNPFLRAGLPEMKAGLDMQSAADADVFAEIRRRKDRF
jgi:hydroxyacylglutathione hydrolase